jgi:hypothetical protein
VFGCAFEVPKNLFEEKGTHLVKKKKKKNIESTFKGQKNLKMAKNTFWQNLQKKKIT